jgi:AcrR family transcriptional regulator
MDLEGETPSRRRHGAELEEALLDAAWDELVERGYSGATYEGVAARAGTSRPVVYRRWPTKRDLTLAAVRHRGDRDRLLDPDAGSLRADLLTLLSEVNRRRAPVMIVLGANAGDFHREAGLSPDALRDEWLGDRATLLDTIVQRAVTRGEVDPVRVTPRTVRLASDLLRHQVLMTMAPATPQWLAQLVDEIVLPVLTGSAPGAAH